jgi:ribosomal protein L14E/L6E/L27E
LKSQWSNCKLILTLSYKPGRVVVVLNGKHTGKKGIIIKSNYENSKDKKFPHCLVVGLSKAPRRVTKKYLKTVDDKTKKLEQLLQGEKKGDESVTEQLGRLRRLGVYVKTYNMSHLLATRYCFNNF